MRNIARSFILFSVLVFAGVASAQVETLTNIQIIEMAKAGIADDVILKKIKNSYSNFDQSTKALIELKNAGVSNAVMSVIVEKVNSTPIKSENTSQNEPQLKSAVSLQKIALSDAKTISFEKSSINPSRQALEKELLKRADWKKLNLAIERYQEKADMYVEIGFVPMSLISHRYVYRIYDRRSGTVIAAGETTSWGSLAKNLARNITKSLTDLSLSAAK